MTGESLSNLRVLEVGSMLAGPFVGSMLADFGAEVIKVEKPGTPDALREWPPHKDGVPLWWKTTARNKKTVTLDLSHPDARDIALSLIGASDVVIENFRPGTLERWGFDPIDLSERFPEVVWVRVSGYGQTGPLSGRGGYATIAEAFSGMASFTGHPDRGPMVSAFPLCDYLAGLTGAFGALAAVNARGMSGRGQMVDVSLFEPILRIIESVIVRYDQTGETKPRLGNQMEEDVPRNVYETADGGYIAISCGSERIFGNLLVAMNREDLKADPRFATMSTRVEHRDAIDGIVADWMKSLDMVDALSRLEDAQVVAGKVNTIADVFNDPHVVARHALNRVADDELGEMVMSAVVPKLSATPGQVKWAGRRSGADNEEVFGDLLGMSESDIQALAGRNVI